MKEKKDKYLIRDLDRIFIAEDGKEYYAYTKNLYFAKKKNGKPDLSRLLTLDLDGNIISSEPFDESKLY